MPEFNLVISLVLLVPYFGWGIYMLRLRYQLHEELPVKVEVVTLVLLLAFYGLEFLFLEPLLATAPILHLFTVLGFAVSGTALYGHMFISLVSRVLVDAILPNDDLNTLGPRFGPAEVLERRGDYEGALNEYLVIARIFPKDPATSVRVANTYLELRRPAEAAPWFERALARIDDDERALTIVNRLCGVFDADLNQPQSALQVLEQFIERYPASQHADRVRLRLVRRKQAITRTTPQAPPEQDIPPSTNLLRL